MKKFLLCFIPYCTPHFPGAAIPSLVSQLRNNNYNVSVMDLNIDFLYTVYSKEYLQNSITKAEEQYKKLQTRKESFYNKMDSQENVILTQKYDILDSFFNEHKELGDRIPLSIEKALQVFRNEELFYNLKLLQYASQVVQYANKVACLPFAPFDFYSSYVKNYSELCNIVFDKNQNIYMEYFEEKINEIKNLNPDYVGVSIADRQQVIPGLTLCYLLKKYTNAHVNIGGNFFSRVLDSIPTYEDFFELFADSVSYAEGENSIIELAKYIDGEIDISQVPQLVYKDKIANEVIKTQLGKPVDLTSIYPPDYTDFDLSKYFSPEPKLPLQIQRGCYWCKCAFCDFPFGKTFSVKPVKTIVDEIKYNKEKHNVSMYLIVDEAVRPEYLNELADEILANNLKISFTIQLRFEEEFDYKLLKKLYDAGLHSIWWGFESASPRLLKLINKGINIDTAKRIIVDADKAGILNVVYTMSGFPTETPEELQETLNFLTEYEKHICVNPPNGFYLTRQSYIYNHPEQFGIKILDVQPNMTPIVDFVSLNVDPGFSLKTQKLLEDFNNKYKGINDPQRFPRAYVTYFVKKYGLDYVKKNILGIK